MKSIQLTFFRENDEKVLTVSSDHIANLKLFGIAEIMRLRNGSNFLQIKFYSGDQNFRSLIM